MLSSSVSVTSELGSKPNLSFCNAILIASSLGKLAKGIDLNGWRVSAAAASKLDVSASF